MLNEPNIMFKEMPGTYSEFRKAYLEKLDQMLEELENNYVEDFENGKRD